MAFAESNQVSWRYIAEVTFGTTPGTPTMKEVLRVSGEINGVNDTVVSNSVRSDRMRQGNFLVGQHVEGNLECELAYGQYDDLIEAVLCGTWSSAATITATTISAATSDDSFNDSGTAFVSSGFLAGMYVLVSGFTDPANNGIFRILAVTSGKLTLSAKITLATGAWEASPNLTLEAAGNSVTIKTAGMLRNGTTARSFTWEQAHADVSQFFQFRGVRHGDMQLEIAAKSLAKLTFPGLMGKSFTRTTSTIASAVTATNSNLAFNTSSNIVGLSEGGSAFTDAISKLSFGVKNNLQMIDAVANLTPPGIQYGVQDLTGELEVYFGSAGSTAIWDKFAANTQTSMTFVMTNAASPVYYIVTIPAYCYSGGNVPAGGLSGLVMAKFPFVAYKGADGYQIQIDKLSTT